MFTGLLSTIFVRLLDCEAGRAQSMTVWHKAWHAADARLWPRRLLRTGRLLRFRWSRGGVVTDAGEMQQRRQQQRQRKKQIPFGKDKQRGVVVRGEWWFGGMRR